MKQISPDYPGGGALAHPLPKHPQRFTLDGSDELENHLSTVCEKVLEGVLHLFPEHNLEALLLGGGYGRGEGGVLETVAGDAPYNDLEFYVCLRGPDWLNERRHQAALHSLGETLSSLARVEVEFKILSLEKLRGSPPSMFYYDLVMRHHCLWGAESLLGDCAHHCAAEQIPLAEATRLLMNRCSGLLFAREQLERAHFPSEAADFVGRNHAKAQLALGDVLLTAHQQYHWSCRERARRLQSLACDSPWFSEVKMHHAEGVNFKLHPQRTVALREQLQKQQQGISFIAEQLWLWLERQRLKCAFPNIEDYSLSGLPKCPETKGWRNYLVNLKSFGPAMLFSRQATRYPRERLLQALPLLLWAPGTMKDAGLLQRTQDCLRTSVRTWPGLVAAYRALWQKFR